MVDPSFTVLCVCTGNVCRSPAAERLLARALGPSVAVYSAGTDALVGAPISPPMDELVAGRGADAAGFSAQLLTLPLLRGADLVLGLTREHRALAVDLAPAVVRRAFTLREYARLLGSLDPGLLPTGTPAERARASVRATAAARRRSSVDEDDIADPYRRGSDAYRQAFVEIGAAVDEIAGSLAPAPGQRSGCSAT